MELNITHHILQFQNWQVVKAPFASAKDWLTTQLYYSIGMEDAVYKERIHSKHGIIW